MYISGADLDRKALVHRRALGFRDDQSVDFMTLITKLKNKYPNFGYLRIPDTVWIHNSEARWNSDTKTVEIPERIFVALNSGSPRALMTVVHEVAHALLGHKGFLHRAPIGNDSERLSKKVRSIEFQARRYAAGFLMPDTPWLRSATPIQIMARYNVSKSAAEFRKQELT